MRESKARDLGVRGDYPTNNADKETGSGKRTCISIIVITESGVWCLQVWRASESALLSRRRQRPTTCTDNNAAHKRRSLET